MATFRTKQFVAISFIIKAFAELDVIDREQLNTLVNHVVISFANDNHLFNERLFRGGCGSRVSQVCIIENVNVKTNNVAQRKYNGRFI